MIAVALQACLVVHSLVAITAVTAVAGAGYGLFNVALFELLDDVVPADRAIEALTWLTTCQGAGLAAGAAGAGALSRSGAMLVLLAIPAALTAGIALTRCRTLRGAPAVDPR